jgi:hypothetical protein
MTHNRISAIRARVSAELGIPFAPPISDRRRLFWVFNSELAIDRTSRRRLLDPIAAGRRRLRGNATADEQSFDLTALIANFPEFRPPVGRDTRKFARGGASGIASPAETSTRALCPESLGHPNTSIVSVKPSVSLQDWVSLAVGLASPRVRFTRAAGGARSASDGGGAQPAPSRCAAKARPRRR